MTLKIFSLFSHELREGEKSLFKEYFLSWWNSGSWKKPYIFPLDVVMVR